MPGHGLGNTRARRTNVQWFPSLPRQLLLLPPILCVSLLYVKHIHTPADLRLPCRVQISHHNNPHHNRVCQKKCGNTTSPGRPKGRCHFHLVLSVFYDVVNPDVARLWQFHMDRSGVAGVLLVQHFEWVYCVGPAASTARIVAQYRCMQQLEKHHAPQHSVF